MPTAPVTTRLRRATPGVEVAGREVVRLHATTHRVHTLLVVPGIDRSIDITSTPAAAVCALEDAAARADVPTSRVHADAIAALTSAATSADAWMPSAATPLLGAFGGAGFPLLGTAYDAGAAPIGSIPPWAVPVLVERDPRSAARVAFGARATRPVIAALARSLIRVAGDPVDLSRLALGLAGSEVLEPDHLVAVLTAPGSPWPPSALPTCDALQRLREATRHWGADRTRGYLLRAALDDDGRMLVTQCAAHAVDLGPHAPRNLPTGLGELRDLYRLQVRTAPVPRPVADTPGRNVARRDAPDHTAVRYRALRAPDAGRPVTVTGHTPLPVPRWLAVLEGTSTSGALGFVLPHRAADLDRWARTMSNCLDSYGQAAATGRSHLVGITRSGELRYVLELSPTRRIRQFWGRANTPVPRADHDRVLGHLRSHRVLP